VVAAHHPTQDILRVDVFAGDVQIGQSIVVFDRATTGGLIKHRVMWANPPSGAHVLTARGFTEDGTAVAVSPPVNIAVGPPPPGVVVSIEASQPIAEETSFPLRRLAFRGELTISRTGPTDGPLPVFLHVGGLATPGADYPVLPKLVTIPVGAASVRLEVVPHDDQIPEGIETLVATLSECPQPGDPVFRPCVGGFVIDHSRSQATVFLRDDGVTEASLAMTHPHAGAHFPAGAVIPIEAVAVDLNGAIMRVEFFDGNTRIGVSEIDTLQPIEPGSPVTHRIDWSGAAPGPHSLTARRVLADGSVLQSPAVDISVGPASERVVVEIEATDPVATEVGADGHLDEAAFTIRRIAGPADVDVLVYYSLTGTARNGVDYAELGGQVRLPAGSDSVKVVVTPIPDNEEEGTESVIARVEPPVCIAIAPPPPECYAIGARAEATAIIRESGANRPPVAAIIRPVSGSTLPVDKAVEIVAETRDPDGYVRRVEFFANDRKLGEVGMDFLLPPQPNQPQVFTFAWNHPTPGPHALTARAIDNEGQPTTSAPLGIKVGTSGPLPIVVVATRDPFALEPRPGGPADTARFRIHRFGPTAEPLTVAYSLAGTAENGVDYAALPGTATIPANQGWVDVVVSPSADSLTEGVETVVLRLQPELPLLPPVPVDAGYQLGSPIVAAAAISDALWSPVSPQGECNVLPGNALHVCFPAESGRNYRLEASPDLRNWETIAEAVGADGAWHFVDADMAAHPMRWYRLLPEPVAGE
jgi:hypothetical protein